MKATSGLLFFFFFLAVPGLKDKTYPAAFPSDTHKWCQMASQENSNFSHQSTLSGMFLRHTVIICPLFQACFLGTPSLFGFLVSGEAPRLPDLAK